MTPRRLAFLSSLALPLALLACGDAPPDRDRSTERRDSAGVVIVEPAPPFPDRSPAPTPAARIGVVDGEAEYQLSDVVHAARLSDGGIVLVDGGSSEVRWYDTDGVFRARAGGPGEGPGELARPVAATLTPEDTLVLYDARNRRLSWFGPDGAFARDRRLELEPGSDVSLHGLRSGRLLIAEEQLRPNFGGDEYNPARDSILVLTAPRAAAALDTVMRLPGRDATTWVDYADGRPVGTRQMKLPLGRVTLVGGAADRIAVVEGGRHDLALFDEDGTVVRLARRQDLDPPEASAELRQEYVADRGRWAREMGMPAAQAEAAAEERLSFLPEGRRVPAFDRLLTDAVEGRIWLRDFLPEWRTDRPRSWTVHDLAGEVVGRVTTPAGFELMHVSRGHLVGVERDALEVEYVVAYPMGPG